MSLPAKNHTMKKLLFSFYVTFLFIGTTFGQNNILKPNLLVRDTKNNMSPASVMLFNLADSRSGEQVPPALKNYSLLTLDKQVLKQVTSQKAPFIELSIPQNGRNSLVLELVEVHPFAEGFEVKTAPEMKAVKVNTGKHYRGIIQGQEKSVAAISIFEDQVMGMISHPSATGNLIIGKLEDSQTHILYQDDQIADQFHFDCQAKDKEFEYTREELYGTHKDDARALSDCVRLYLEVDHDIFLNKGSNTTTVTTFITGIFNQVSTLYANEQINTVVSEIVIWTQPSPYSSTSSIGMLNAFTAYRQGFNGDLAQLLSFQASGGVAYVDGICRSNPDYSMGYAGIGSTYQNVPTYSWTVEVCAHEFGHLFGSQHTHACVWNGNNTAIDGCYAPEGSCSNPGLPTGGGTVMSYCHLTSAGINFSNGFGIQPGNVMRSKVTAGTCLQACSGNGGGSGGGGGGGTGTCTGNNLTLEVRTDNYPAETTWNIKNSSGTILYSGGPYSVSNTLNNISLCLPTGCYTFTINDAYGDGICCVYGSGYYNVKQGNTVLITGGTFGSTETKTFCASGTPSCTDGIQNGTETGVDCGGANCPACPTCTDGIKNGLETSVDCGGPTCPACPTCSDGVQNGSETGTDCGGTCAPCQSNGNVQITTLAGHYFESGWDGWTDGGIDCARLLTTLSPEGSYSIQLRDNEGSFSSVTSPVYNLTSYDSVTVEFKFRAVSFEATEDFWLRYYNGTQWVTVKTYVVTTDFANDQIYTRKVKINSPLSALSQFRFQTDAGDNSDQLYVDAVIIKAYKTTTSTSCSDGVQNGLETGVDCGGPNCPACPTCTDGIKNGLETSVDCGGPTCPACPTCTDGIQNGNETGVDCGGACAACNTGSTTTLSGHYFETGWDGWIDGGSDCFWYLGTQSPEGSYSIRIRDNSLEGSAMTSPTYNLAPYNTVSVEFKFRAEGMDPGEDFWLMYFNGSTWNNIGTFTNGAGFENNILYTTTVNITGQLSNIAKFRFQCDASENDDIIYIDAVLIKGTTGSGLIAAPFVITEEPGSKTNVDSRIRDVVQLFPNPVTDKLSVTANEKIIRLQIYSMSGKFISDESPSPDKSEVDVSLLPAGMYVMRVETEEDVFVKRFIKN